MLILNFEVAVWLIHIVSAFVIVKCYLKFGEPFLEHTIKVALGALVANKN